MNCSRKGCPGKYRDELIMDVTSHKGVVTVIDHVPVMVCDFCGIKNMTLETLEQLQRIDIGGLEPLGSVPLYDYTQAFPEALRDKLAARGYASVDLATLPTFTCRITGKPSRYLPENVAYLAHRNGQSVVVIHVPRMVCDVCTDTLYEEQTLRQLDHLLDSDIAPIGTAPLYEFAQGAMQTEKELAGAKS